MLSWYLTKLTTLVSRDIHVGMMLTRPDNVCIESLSIDLTRPMLDSAVRSVTKLGEKIEE